MGIPSFHLSIFVLLVAMQTENFHSNTSPKVEGTFCVGFSWDRLHAFRIERALMEQQLTVQYKVMRPQSSTFSWLAYRAAAYREALRLFKRYFLCWPSPPDPLTI